MEEKDGQEYIRNYGIDEFSGKNDVVYTRPIPFYFKSKEFKDGTLSKKKALSSIWLNYDLDGEVNIKITTDDGKEYVEENALLNGKNRTQCVLIPTDMQNANSYTFEFYGQGDITIYAMERNYRTKVR